MIFSQWSLLCSPSPPAAGSSCRDPPHAAAASSPSSANELHRGPPAISLYPGLIGPLLYHHPLWGSAFLRESNRNFLERILSSCKLHFHSCLLSFFLFSSALCWLIRPWPAAKVKVSSEPFHCASSPLVPHSLSRGVGVAVISAFKTWLKHTSFLTSLSPPHPGI